MKLGGFILHRIYIKVVTFAVELVSEKKEWLGSVLCSAGGSTRNFSRARHASIRTRRHLLPIHPVCSGATSIDCWCHLI